MTDWTDRTDDGANPNNTTRGARLYCYWKQLLSFFNNEPFLPRFVGLVRQVRTVRQSRQHFPDGPDRIRLPDCGLFQDEFQVFARIFLPGDPAGKDSKSGLDRFRDFPEESVLIPVVGQQGHSLFKSASVRYHFFRIVRTKVTALFQIAVTKKNIAAAP